MVLAAPLTLATSWQAAIEGATVRDLYSGLGGSGAMWAPRYVASGFTGADDDVAHVFGHVASDRFDQTALADQLGKRWEITRNYFKIHACCRNFQSAIDAALDLKRDRPFAASDIARVHVATFGFPVRDNASAMATNVLAARESLPLSMALALIHGHCGTSVYVDENVFSQETAQLAAKVEVVLDSGLDALFPEKRPSRVTVSLNDGRILEGYAEVARGDPAWPLTQAELEAKFHELTAHRSRGSVEGLHRAAGRVEALSSIGELTEYLRTP
jgi:2-methylcitrate dehydratase PrpD